MSVRTEDGDGKYRTMGVEAADLQRYEAVDLENGEVVIYDTDNEDAWVQSASGIGLEFMR